MRDTLPVPVEPASDDDLETLIERVVRAAEDFKQKPMKPASRRRIKKLLRALCVVSPGFEFGASSEDRTRE